MEPIEEMVAEIEAEVRATADLLGKAALAPEVRAALLAVPRHAFVSSQKTRAAYVNAPLPIGHGQTISQPYIVAVMTDLLELRPHHRVLEVGTGCGYQTAILARLAARVYSIEIVPELARDAAARLGRMGYDDIELRTGDGHLGWPQAAPFDAILVAAAARRVPRALGAQLAVGGRMILPIARRFRGQELVLVEKDAAGRLHQRFVLPVAFVPMVAGRP